MSSDTPIRLRTLAIYPVKGEPGTLLQDVEIEPEGLAGDRRKKRPVHVVGAEETPESTRANLFVDAPEQEVRSWVGRRLAVGGAVLDVLELPSGCAGVYATVARSGPVAVGDDVEPD